MKPAAGLLEELRYHMVFCLLLSIHVPIIDPHKLAVLSKFGE
jgi:hypothetical protein